MSAPPTQITDNLSVPRPEHWGLVRAKYVFSEIADLSIDGEEALLSVTEQRGVVPRETLVSQEEELSRAESLVGYKRCKEGDLVINIMLAWKRALGIAPQAGIVSPSYAVFRPHGIHSSYAHYLLRSDLYISDFNRRSTGIVPSRNRLYPEEFGNTWILLPPLEEQRSIAEFLDYETARIDELVREQERLIGLIDEKRLAYVSHLVTHGPDPKVPTKDSGVKLLGNIPSHWEVAKLGRLAVKIGSGKTPRGGATAYVDEGVLFLRSQNVYDDGLRLESAVYIDADMDEEMQGTRVRPLDVLINITGASIGRTSIVPQGFPPANVNQHVAIIRLRHPIELAEWVAVVLQTSYSKTLVQLAMSGAARDGLTGEEIAQFRLPIPPLDERTAIIAHLEELESDWTRLTAAAIQAKRLLQQRRSALVSAAVTGQLDLRDWKLLERETAVGVA